MNISARTVARGYECSRVLAPAHLTTYPPHTYSLTRHPLAFTHSPSYSRPRITVSVLYPPPFTAPQRKQRSANMFIHAVIY